MADYNANFAGDMKSSSIPTLRMRLRHDRETYGDWWCFLGAGSGRQ